MSATARRGRSRHWLDLDTGADPFPVPGGSFRCSFSIGHARATAAFTSGGPIGEAVDVAVCAGADTNDYDGFLICRADESGGPIAAPDSVVCNAVYPQATGKTSTIDTLRDGQPVKAKVTVIVPSPLHQVGSTFRPTAGTPVPAGDYDCRFSLDGTVVADKPFHVSAPSSGR